MISQVELSKGCLFPCPIYAQLRLSVLLIKTASFFPSLVPHIPLPSRASASRDPGQAGPQPQLGLLRTGLWSVWGFLNPPSLEFRLLRKLRT